VSEAAGEWVERECPVCHCVLAAGGDEDADRVVADHRTHWHGVRQPHRLFPFPADAAVTVGTGKTLYKFWKGWSPDGTWRLVALHSGKKLTTPRDRVRWDGMTFWTWSGTVHRDLIYTDLQEG
jgi:hypothetical protein